MAQSTGAMFFKKATSSLQSPWNNIDVVPGWPTPLGAPDGVNFRTWSDLDPMPSSSPPSPIGIVPIPVYQNLSMFAKPYPVAFPHDLPAEAIAESYAAPSPEGQHTPAHNNSWDTDEKQYPYLQEHLGAPFVQLDYDPIDSGESLTDTSLTDSCPPTPPSGSNVNSTGLKSSSVDSLGTQADPTPFPPAPMQRLPIPPCGRKPPEFYEKLAAASPGEKVFDGHYDPTEFFHYPRSPVHQDPRDAPPKAIPYGLNHLPEMGRYRPHRPSPEVSSSDQERYIGVHSDIDFRSGPGQRPPIPQYKPPSPHGHRLSSENAERTPSPSTKRKVIHGQCQSCRLIEPVPQGWVPDQQWEVGVLRWCADCGSCTTWLAVDEPSPLTSSPDLRVQMPHRWRDFVSNDDDWRLDHGRPLRHSNGKGRESLGPVPMPSWDEDEHQDIGWPRYYPVSNLRNRRDSQGAAERVRWDRRVMPLSLPRPRHTPPFPVYGISGRDIPDFPRHSDLHRPRPWEPSNAHGHERHSEQVGSPWHSNDRDPVRVNDGAKPSDECDICMERTKDHCLDPCGHRYCGSCIATLRNKVCPICTREFVKAIKLF